MSTSNEPLSGSERTALVAQAIARVCEQNDCSVVDAILLMRSEQTDDRTLHQVAAAVVNRRLRFDRRP